ncbi:MAG: diphosphomevalonate/mevalonate 3,5-bisphosphate decarboxylase family protein [Bdellovibrionales bacterium]
MPLRIETSAPSNIALIKYMGKSNGDSNLPANSSLSMTLEHLRSHVRIESADREHEGKGAEDRWRPLPEQASFYLSETGKRKFLSHFARLKEAWKISGTYTISSGNDFPSDCGLASSASSFAALTRAAYELARSQHPDLQLSVEELSKWSRLGSGSSCRSFFSPWSVWKSEGAEPLDLDLRLEHAVVLVESGVKAVSSSQAHERVASSLLFEGRVARARERLIELESGLRSGEWRRAFELCWSEFWDMHALFETSDPSFGYMQAGSFQVLEQMRDIWRREGDGPLVTMDAGPNVHLLIRPDQTRQAESWLRGRPVLTSWRRQIERA